MSDPSRAKDLARITKSRTARSVSALWDALKTQYTAATRRRIEKMFGDGLPSFADILMLRLADAVEIKGDINAARKAGNQRNLERMLSARSAALSAAHRCIADLGPDLSPNQQPVRLPEGFTLHEVPAPKDLLGDDLVN